MFESFQLWSPCSLRAIVVGRPESTYLLVAVLIAMVATILEKPIFGHKTLKWHFLRTTPIIYQVSLQFEFI